MLWERSYTHTVLPQPSFYTHMMKVHSPMLPQQLFSYILQESEGSHMGETTTSTSFVLIVREIVTPTCALVELA